VSLNKDGEFRSRGENTLRAAFGRLKSARVFGAGLSKTAEKSFSRKKPCALLKRGVFDFRR